MASIHRDVDLAASADFVWDALRDVGAPHRRVARGFVTATVTGPGERTVTFANGLTARELVVELCDERRRLAYSIVGGRALHHNASFEVQPLEAARCRVRWTTDVLPDDMREPFARMIEAGIAAMRQTLEADFAAANGAPGASAPA
jgi:hypothetical protein